MKNISNKYNIQTENSFLEKYYNSEKQHMDVKRGHVQNQYTVK